MEILKGIEIVDTALFVKKQKIVIINDLHIGYEGELHAKGILIPRFQLDEIILKIEKIINKTKAKTLVINGDLKHEFGRISNTEWREVLQFLDFVLKKVKVVVIQGNHDPIIKPILEKKNLQVVSKYIIDDIAILHGDEIIDTKAKTIIIGHEHPAITIKEGSKIEKYKCFLKGKWGRKNLIVVPSFNPLLEGSDVLQGNMLSPYLTDVSKFSVYITNKGEVFNFGKVKKLSGPKI